MEGVGDSNRSTLRQVGGPVVGARSVCESDRIQAEGAGNIGNRTTLRQVGEPVEGARRVCL
jgi:hypothetical protein